MYVYARDRGDTDRESILIYGLIILKRANVQGNKHCILQFNECSIKKFELACENERRKLGFLYDESSDVRSLLTARNERKYLHAVAVIKFCKHTL